jgi:hypothetical protein
MLLKLYRPASFVVVFRAVFVAPSINWTSAPVTAPPCWSFTWPATAPVAADCATAGATLRLKIAATTTAKMANIHGALRKRLWLDTLYLFIVVSFFRSLDWRAAQSTPQVAELANGELAVRGVG